MQEEISAMLADVQKMQMQNLTVNITFYLRGHTVAVIGQNPDAVINAVEALKKNKNKLTVPETSTVCVRNIVSKSS
jgi:hypothetical protein